MQDHAATFPLVRGHTGLPTCCITDACIQRLQDYPVHATWAGVYNADTAEQQRQYFATVLITTIHDFWLDKTHWQVF